MANEAATSAKTSTALAPVTQRLVDSKHSIITRLPAGIDKDRFFLGIITAVQRSKYNSAPGKSLADCDPNSVLLAAFDAADCGCPLSPALALGWLIPYDKQAQFQPSYRFFIQKAYETKEVKTFYAEVVYKGDQLERQFAPKRNLFHAPGTEERTLKTAIGAYAFIEFTDGTQDWEYMTSDQIDRHRKHSKQPNSIMWTTFWEEAWRKTPIRVLAKRLPLKSRDFEGLVEMINTDTARDSTVTTEEIESITSIGGPKRASETEKTEHAKTADKPAETKTEPAQQSQTQPAEPAKEKNGKAAPQPEMFNQQKDPLVGPTDITKFWDIAFNPSNAWDKGQVAEMLKKNFNVTAVKDLRQSQYTEALGILQQARE